MRASLERGLRAVRHFGVREDVGGDAQRGSLVRDERLDDASFRVEAKHVRRARAIDDRRAEPEPDVHDAFACAPRPVAHLREHHARRLRAHHSLQHDGHPEIAYAMRGEIIERAPRRDRRPHFADRGRDGVVAEHGELRLREPGHRQERIRPRTSRSIAPRIPMANAALPRARARRARPRDRAGDSLRGALHALRLRARARSVRPRRGAAASDRSPAVDRGAPR